nr:MAG TPA: Pectate lyase [Bacteriophage sp.]
MGINPIHKAPYTNFHDLNLDWVIEVLNEFNTRLTNFVSLATIKYADPLQWDITSQYEANTVVVDSNGNAYLSVKPVPSGVSLDRVEFWTKIGNFDELWADVKKAITPNDEGHSPTATAARAVNDLVWVNGALVRVTKAMIAGDSYVPGSNCVSSSTNEVVHYLVKAFTEGLNAEQTARENADTQLQTAIKDNKTAIENEQTARENADTQLQTAIENEQTARENADTLLQTAIDNEQTARENADTQLQNSINQMQTYISAPLAGIKANDQSAAAQNTSKLQQLLDAGQTVYFPSGNYYMSEALYMKRGCGIIGENMRDTAIIWITASNGIIYDLEYKAPNTYDNIYFTIRIESLALYGVGATNGAGSGIYIRNKTWMDTAKQNHDEYRKIKGDSYALECRNSVIRDIIVSGWSIGINSSLYIAYVSVINAFVETCDLGIDAKFSDSELCNIVVTFCYKGILCESEANKWCNLAIKMNGWRASYDASHPITGSIALHLYHAKRELFCNTEVQESYANGVVVESTSNNIVFSGLLLDANGFKVPEGTDGNNIGLQIREGSYNIRGTILATNKNDVKCQRVGIFVSPDCGNIDLQYAEYEQKSSAWTLGRNTCRSITTAKINNITKITAPNFTNGADASYASFDGRNLHIAIHGYFSAATTTGASFTVASAFGDIPFAQLPGNVYRDIYLYNSTDNVLVPAAYDNTTASVIIKAPVPPTKQINCEVTFDML